MEIITRETVANSTGRRFLSGAIEKDPERAFG